MNNESEPLLQRGIFLRMYNIGHLFEFIHSLYSGKRFKLEKQCTERLAELSKVENSISPDILGPCHLLCSVSQFNFPSLSLICVIRVTV